MNEKFAHTPGPWVYAYTRIGHTVRQCPGAVSALLVTNVSDSPEADARLIAAAPELFEALRALGSAFMSHTQWNGEPPAEILQARAAINKALGVEA